MNIFDNLRVYAGKWSVKSKRGFNKEELSLITSAKVVSSQYGLSVCFMLKEGGSTYLPLDVNSTLVEGDIVNMESSNLVTLEKSGENDILRVEA